MGCWSANQQVCASCRYWGGKRDIDFMAQFFTAEEDRGKCCNPKGQFRSTKMDEGAWCSDWEAFKGL